MIYLLVGFGIVCFTAGAVTLDFLYDDAEHLLDERGNGYNKKV